MKNQPLLHVWRMANILIIGNKPQVPPIEAMVDGVEDRKGVFTPPTNDPPNVFGGVTTEKDMLIGFHHTITRRTRDDRDFYTSTGKVKAIRELVNL
nr:hypothetical protein [Tanacetum cinerariifolium]